MAAIPVFPMSCMLRTASFLQQWLILILLIIALLASAVAMQTVNVSGYICKMMDEFVGTATDGKNEARWWWPFDWLKDFEQCTEEIKGYLILAWAFVFIIGVPLQIFTVSFFKAFRDNLLLTEENKNFSGR